MLGMNSPRLRPVALVLIAAAALCALVAGLFSSRSSATSDAAATPRPALAVTTARPQATQLPIRLVAHGNITAWQEASISSESNGLKLAEVRANVGDTVRAGQVLATFAAEAVQADLAQARASLLEAEATAADAAANAERARTLQASGALSAQQISQFTTGEQTARARVEAARATLAAQQLRLKYTQVLAPDSGVISARSATVGSVVGAGTELFRMIRQGRLEWRAEVTSTELGRLAAGTPALVTAASGAQLRGRLRMVAPTVDPQTRSALVYVDLPPMGAGNSVAGVGTARPGMFAKGEFDLGSSAALTVPQQAVVVRDGFSYVFRLNADGRVSQLKVQTGRRAGTQVELLGGLTADAEVVAGGAGFLNDGDLVRKVQDVAATPTSNAQGATK
jgi:RND family efflux transporter MFP subunit